MWDFTSILSAGAGLAVRAASIPLLLGLRAFGLAGTHPRPGAEPTLPTHPPARQAARALADELFLAGELLTAPVAPFHRSAERARMGRELDDALALFEWRGWLDQPTQFHSTPAPLERPKLSNASHAGLDYQHLRFPSEWEPPRAAPRRARCLGDAPNRTAHAWLLRHSGRPRPWIVCVPGYRMGLPSLDFNVFRARWLHETLGLNVAVPVLPFHGPRRSGWRSGDGLLTGNIIDGIYGIAQGVWDTRRIIRWLNRQGTPAVGLYGVSLGAYTSAIVSGLERDLTCVIAGVPVSSWTALARGNVPRVLSRASEGLGVPWEKIEQLLRVVSPLAIEPLMPVEQRFVFAGSADRLAHPAQARALAAHWGMDEPFWYAGAHATFWLEPEVNHYVESALERTGMLHLSAEAAQRPLGERPRAAARRGGARDTSLPPAAVPPPSSS